MTDSNATELLLPCPFCGGKAYDHAGMLIGGKKESVHIICETCGAKVYGVTEAKAIEAWNTRTPEQAVAVTLGAGECAECAKGMGAYADSLCDPLKEQLDKLLRCLENDYGISASWDGLRKVWTTEAATLGAPTLTAEQVADAVLDNFEETHETRYDHWEPSKFYWQDIADELNERLRGKAG